MNNFDDIYNPIDIYSNIEQTNSNDFGNNYKNDNNKYNKYTYFNHNFQSNNPNYNNSNTIILFIRVFKLINYNIFSTLINNLNSLCILYITNN